MAELVLITLSREQIRAATKSVARGEATAVDVFGHLWDEYAERDLSCFLCDGICAKPRPFAMMLPDRDATKMIAAPLCPGCQGLPQMVRLGRCLKLLRRMNSKQRRR
jgi:hypothetical protein